jgi:hypothetical protein
LHAGDLGPHSNRQRTHRGQSLTGRNHLHLVAPADPEPGGQGSVNRHIEGVRAAYYRCRNGIRGRRNEARTAHYLHHLHMPKTILQDRGQLRRILEPAAISRDDTRVRRLGDDFGSNARLKTFEKGQRDDESHDANAETHHRYEGHRRDVGSPPKADEVASSEVQFSGHDSVLPLRKPGWASG